MLTRRLIVLSALFMVSGCALENQGPPALSGPSELGLSLAITATPDVITQDGQSQATVEIVARDADSRPAGGVALRVETMVGDVPVDIGTLSTKSLVTGSDGRASLLYRAPAPPGPNASSDTLVAIAVTPVGSDYHQAVPRTVQIRLARPGIILPPNGAPVPDFFYSPTQPREDDTILFDGSISTDADGQIVSYSWNFGDGGAGTGVRVTHSFNLAGAYNVVLTVTDDRGITVSSAPKSVQVGSIQLPTAAFTYSPTEPIVDQAISFNGTPSKATAGRYIASYDWDWGDGTSHGSGATPQHAYAVPGTYVVVLNVTDDTGRSTAVSQEVEVTVAAPVAGFSVSPPTATAGVTAVTFNGTLSTAPPGRTIASYAWDFGDGTSSNAAAPAHTYAVAGTYTVVLTVTDNTGVQGVTSKTVSVTP